MGLAQALNVCAMILLGLMTWEQSLFAIVCAKAADHPHLTPRFIYLAAGCESMAYAFVLGSIITSIAKQSVNAALDQKLFGDGAWMTGPHGVTRSVEHF